MTYTRSNDNLLDVMKLFMEQQTKQLQQQTLQWEQRFEAEREQREQMRKEKEWQEERLKEERDQREMHLREEQRLMEEKRQKHELELLKRQQEFEAARREDERKRKIADNLTKWEDGDQPEAYLLKFEDTMKQAGVPQQEWPHRLRPLLTDSALTAYSRDVPEDAKESYPEFKEALLNALGLSVKQCRLDLWNLIKTPEETYQETARKIEFMTNRMLYGCHCIPDVHTMLSLSKFLTVCPPEAVYCVQLNSPKSTVEAANLVQEYFHNQPNREHRKYTRFNL